MPELPEVETIKNELASSVVGRCINGVTLNWEGMVAYPSAKKFCQGILGKRIVGLKRRGKYLIFNLDNGDLLIIHLKMTGALILGNDLSHQPEYTRAVIRLDNGDCVYFRDPRKFGKMRLVKDGTDIIGKLGIEPLEDSFKTGTLVKLLSKRKAPVKMVLLDQTVIAGIGNMYADEALFAAKIHPLRRADSLSYEEIGSLYRAIRKVLRAAIVSKGASVNTYYRPDGGKGTAHFYFKVAHRRGENCYKCGEPLEYIKVRNRGTYFCRQCQPKKC